MCDTVQSREVDLPSRYSCICICLCIACLCIYVMKHFRVPVSEKLCLYFPRDQDISLGLTARSATFQYVGGYFEFTRWGSLQPVRVDLLYSSRHGCLVASVDKSMSDLESSVSSFVTFLSSLQLNSSVWPLFHPDGKLEKAQKGASEGIWTAGLHVHKIL